MAATDPVLNTKIDTYDPMGLPVFQSMNLTGTMIETLTKEQTCGELSRVVVSEEFRGRGLSELLVWFAVLQAFRRGVRHLLLECLPLHERLYGKFGFQRMQGITGRVIGVDKSMIAMELSALALEQMHREERVGRFVKAMREIGCLQTCHAAQCIKADCGMYTQGKCLPQ